MNNMKKQGSRGGQAPEEDHLRNFADSVGDFIRYWGFRRIHGQIWAQVYLSRESLSGAELTARLRVSKALVSPALKELERHGLIRTAFDGNKTKRYSAEPDVMAVIKGVLAKRESKLIESAGLRLAALEKSHRRAGAVGSLVREERLAEVRRMVDLAQMMVGLVGHQLSEIEQPR